MVLLNLATKWIGYGRLLLAVILVLVFACGGDAKPTPAAITDSSGIEVVFDQSPQRIIAYDSAPVEILYAMGEGERVVGTHDFTTHPAEAVDIPKVGSAFQINSEKIVELEPDLIYTFYSGSLPDLEDLGIRVLYLEQPATLDEISEQMRMWGKITGKVEAAEGVATDFETGVNEIRDRLASVGEGPRLLHDDSEFFTRGPDTLVGRVYSLLKAQNIAEGGYGQLSPEVIVDRDPEVIITTFPEGVQAIIEHPALQNVSAVRDGRVYAVDANIVSISVAGPRFVDAMEVLARLIHPDLFE